MNNNGDKEKVTLTQRKRLKQFINHGCKTSEMVGPDLYKNLNSARAGISRLLAMPQIRSEFLKSLARKGYSIDDMVSSLVEMSRANRISYFSFRGIVTDERETPDFQARAAAIGIIMRALCLDRKDSEIQGINIGSISVDDIRNLDSETLDLLLIETYRELGELNGDA